MTRLQHNKTDAKDADLLADEEIKLPQDARKKQPRHQRLQDATEGARVRESVTNTLRDGLITRATEADFAHDTVRRKYGSFIGNIIVDAKRQFRSATGAARLNDEASAGLDRTLEEN